MDQAEHYSISTLKATEWLSHPPAQLPERGAGEKRKNKRKKGKKKRANHKLTAGQSK